MADTPINHEQSARKTRGLRFVEYIIDRCQRDPGTAAKLKRADNPATEYQSWEVLAAVGVDIAWENQRLPHATVAASIARGKVKAPGELSLGQAIAACFEEGSESPQAKARLRRLLACSSVDEACRILRPLLNLIESRSSGGLDYARLLDDLLWFHNDESQLRIKSRWARDFYRRGVEGGNDE